MCAAVIVTLATLTLYQPSQPVALDDQAWKAFMLWLEAQPPNGDPMLLLGGYRDALVGQGLTAEDASQLASAASALVFRRPEGVRLLWDKVYAGDNKIFADRPTALVIEATKDRPAGTALDVGMGQGRNALYLALNKWRVSGFDPSGEGVRQAEASARRLGLALEASISSDEKFEFGEGRWDLIVVTYVRELTRSDAERYWKALRPGGIVVYENSASQKNDVLEAFLGYRILRWEDAWDTPDWRPDSRVRVQRMVAEKPAR